MVMPRPLKRGGAGLIPPMGDIRLLGRILIDMGALSEADLRHALCQQRRIDAQLGDICVAEGLITSTELQQALAQQHGLAVADLAKDPPDKSLRAVLSPDVALRHMAVPWRHFGDILLIATAHPDRFADLMAERSATDSTSDQVVLPVLADSMAVRDAIEGLYGSTLAIRAEYRVRPDLSCRRWAHSGRARLALAAGLCAGLALLAWLVPVWLATVLGYLTAATLALSMGLKLTASATQLLVDLKEPRQRGPENVTPLRMPRVSVMVPLLREREIADALLRRLSRLTYPKALLDVVLVLEDSDHVTQETLARTKLPPWMRVVRVPASSSGLMTKPRALNYALDFCRGSIIGVWDAEDAPNPDQIEQVVTGFQKMPREVICLQGQLDYYNPRANWITRCFTIEYATWWRLIMPGLSRLGFVIPLGGTTLFFRRKELEELGGWDAHNVTEDADLGIRLARAGYRTELLPTVTHEEATALPWSWVRQRSRWLKGFAVTWAVHMRAPWRLLADLGLYRFLGLQLFFITALSQATLAPVFWAFWLMLFGLGGPFADIPGLFGFVVFFLACETLNLCLHLTAVRRSEHRHLMTWTPTMIVYVQMNCLAMYKALYELVLRPFFWDKTQHGVTLPTKRRKRR